MNLRTRTSRREEPLDPRADRPATADAEKELMLTDSVGLALLVVLDKLEPAERIAFVLHDLFNVPFDEIATIVSENLKVIIVLLQNHGFASIGGDPESGSLPPSRSSRPSAGVWTDAICGKAHRSRLRTVRAHTRTPCAGRTPRSCRCRE